MNEKGDVVRHEFDWYGNHRLVVNGTTGEWTNYQGIAKCDGYEGKTAYWEGKEIVEKVTRERVKAGEVQVCRECGRPFKVVFPDAVEVRPFFRHGACEHMQAILDQQTKALGYTTE